MVAKIILLYPVQVQIFYLLIKTGGARVYLDIFLIVAFAVCVFLGAKKGFAATIMGFCSYIVSIVLGVIFFDSFKEFVYGYKPVAEMIEAFEKTLETAVESRISVDNLPVFIEGSVRNLGNEVASAISHLIIESVIAVLFIVLLIILIKVCAFLVCKIVKIPVLKQFNMVLGGMVGALNGVIICYVFGALLIFAFTGHENLFITNQIETSVIGAYFFKNNLILNVLVGM